MEKHILLGISNGGLLFQLFYVLGFLTAYAILIYEGFRRKFPLIAWILVLACIQLFIVAGTKVFSFSSDEWRFMFQNHILLQNSQKSLFGGIFLGISGYLLARYFLKFRYSVLDAFAVAFPVAISIQTIGCFFYGCCFGKPSSTQWAVQYPVMTLPHYHQFESGLLTSNNLNSLPIHPVQLYLMLGGIVVVCLVIRFRKYWKAKGSLFLSSVIFFILMSFLIEFFRDPLSHKTGGEMIWILRLVQWQYLFLAVLMTLLLIWREKTFTIKHIVRSNDSPRLSRQIAFLSSVGLIFLMLRNWFTLTEIIALNIALLPAVFFIGVEIYRTFASLRHRWIFVCSLLLPLLLMSQTLPQTQIDTTRTKKYKSYHTIGGGFATGNYTDYKTIYSGSGCDRVSNTQYFSQKYTEGGLGYSFTKTTTDGKEEIRYGANGLFGNYTETRQSDNVQVNNLLFEINPYIKYDIRWIGIGGGLHIGNIIFTIGDREKEGQLSESYKNSYFKTPIFPQFYFRVGPLKYLYADFHLADQFPVSIPGLVFQAGIGTGFGLKNGLNIRFGRSFLDKGGYYTSAFIPIKNQIVLEPLFLWTMTSDSYPVKLPEKQFSFGLSYRFGHK
jgi:phosphatidylglycerol:prolipoprotein diacylglycerol transferase